MARVTCPRCKGEGEVVEIDWFDAVTTLGLAFLSAILNPVVCPICGGQGLVDTDRLRGI